MVNQRFTNMHYTRTGRIKFIDNGIEFIYDPTNLENFLNELNDKILELEQEVEDWEFANRTEMAHHRVEENALQDKINSLREERRQLKIIAESLMEYIKVNCTDDIVMHARNLMDGYKLSDWSEDYQEWRGNL